MGDCQSKPAKSTSPHHTPIREWTKILESLEKVILNINEDNIGESVSETMNLLSNNISPCPNLTLSRLIYSAYVSQRKDFNIYINFMKALDIKEKEINEKKFNKNNSDMVHAFANFLLHLCSQESNFLLGKMIEMKLISPYFIKSKKTFYFANYLNTEIINKLKKNQVPFSQYFFENYEELSKNDWEIHKKLIKKGVNPNEISKIIRNDEIEKLQEISSQEDFNFNQIIKPSLYERCSFINQENVSLIDFAAFFGSVKCFKYLLMNDVDIKNTGKYAIAGGNEEIIYLCEQNHSTFENALETSIKFHRNEIFHYFYENEIIDDSSTKITNLFLFTENPCMNVELFNFFLEQKRINFNSKSEDGKTALIWASKNGHIEIVKLLLEQKGIQINAKDKWGKTALIYASLYGNTEIFKLLLKQKGIHINAKDKGKETAFLRASFFGNTEIVKLLLEKEGKCINMKSKEKALIYAAENGHSAIVKVLLKQKGINVNTKSKYLGETALMNAARYGNIKTVKLLLEQEGIDINAKSKWGWTSLILASWNGHTDIVQLLLEQEGIDVNAKSNDEETALIWASKEGHIDIVKLLLKQKDIDINAKNKYLGETALMIASYKGNKEIVELFLEHDGNDVNIKSNYGKTALMYASTGSQSEIENLLRQKSQINKS